MVLLHVPTFLKQNSLPSFAFVSRRDKIYGGVIAEGLGILFYWVKMVRLPVRLSLADVAHALILFCLSAIFPAGNPFLLKKLYQG